MSRYKDGAFTHYYRADEFFSTNVTSLYEDRAGSMWFTTANGLIRSAKGSFATYTTQDGRHDRTLGRSRGRALDRHARRDHTLCGWALHRLDGAGRVCQQSDPRAL